MSDLLPDNASETAGAALVPRTGGSRRDAPAPELPGEPRSAAKSSALIVGGGLAGAAVAILLARASHATTLVEQHAAARHKVCGDFLSAEGLESLRRLGLEPLALGAVALTTLRLAAGDHLVETPLPFPAASLTRFTLDEALLRLAAAAGATLLRGDRAESLTRSQLVPSAGARPADAGEWQLHLASGRTLRAETAFLATGKHDLRGHPRPAGRHGSLVAFKHHLRLTPAQHRALGTAIELTLFPHGYAGLQPVEPDGHGPRANLCLVLERDQLRSLGGNWPALLAWLLRVSPHLRTRIADAEPLLEQPLALAKIPYGLLRASAPEAGLWPVGDQAAVIPSLTGDGMSIALHTAQLAAALFLGGQPAAAYCSTLHRQLHRQLTLATVASRLAVQPALQPVIAALARVHPPLLQHLARLTRIPGLVLAAR